MLLVKYYITFSILSIITPTHSLTHDVMSLGLSASYRGGAHRGPGAGSEAGVGELRLLLPDGADNKKMILILY